MSNLQVSNATARVLRGMDLKALVDSVVSGEYQFTCNAVFHAAIVVPEGGPFRCGEITELYQRQSGAFSTTGFDVSTWRKMGSKARRDLRIRKIMAFAHYVREHYQRGDGHA